ncbi:MAG: hypothetical protein JNL83_03545 [Myxococcales bacterium]|nr:hypothetical protein [Myxococcales bacterium]
MRSTFVLAAALLAGCGADLGGPCSPTELCEVGVCDLTNPGGGICVDGDSDADGDGIPAARDFCQHEMGGEYDEDLDGIGDICDACPIAPPPASPDADGDEVESPCDPDPSTAGEQIVVFDGFNGSEAPVGWKVTTGWEFRGGEAIATPGSPTATALLSAPLSLASSHMAALTRYRVDRVDTTATENAAQVIAIDRRPAGVTIVSCAGTRVAGMDRLALDTGVMFANDVVDSLFDPAALYRAVLRIDGAQAQCALIGDADAGAAQANTNGENMTEAGLGAKGATIRFGYLLAVQRPN